MSFQADVQRYLEDARSIIEHYLPQVSRMRARATIIAIILIEEQQDRNSRLLLAGGAATVAGIVLFPLAHHFVLGRQVVHTHPSPGSLWASVECGEVESLPKSLTENLTSKSYRVAHDKVTKHIKDVTVALSADPEQDFTGVLRNNFTAYNKTPASWFVWLGYSSPSQRETFKTEYINKLKFQKGDVVNGAFEVVKRTPLKVEMAFLPPPNMEAVKGLLVIMLRPRNEGTTLISETIQWTEKTSGVTLPLESWLWKFLHSLSARWCVLSGAAFLRGSA